MATLLKTANFSGNNGSHFYIQLYYDIYSQSTAENKTIVQYDMYVGSTDGYSATFSWGAGYIGKNYETRVEVGNRTNIPRNSWNWVGGRQVEYQHNEDGTCTATYYGLFATTGDIGNADLSGTITLPRINRYAMITTANAYNDEENPTMEFTNNLMYNLRAKLKVGNEVIYNQDLSDSSVTSYTFELTNAQRTRLRQLCTGQYLNTTFQIISLENNVEKYISSKDVQMTIINANPTFTYSVVETNPKVISALGSSSANSIIDNVSQVKISVTPTTYKEATMSRFWVKHDGKEYQDDTSPYEITIPITADRFSFDVVDSRGLSPTPTLLIKTLIEYEPLKINSYTFKRENPISSNVILNLDVLYYNSFGNVANVLVVKWKLADGNYTTIPSNYYTIDSANHKLTISNYEISNILPYNQQGQFSIYIEDKLTSAEDTGANGLVLKGVATFDAGEHDLQINGDLYIADINRENKVNVKDLHKVTLETDGSATKTGRIIDGYEEYAKRITLDDFPSGNQTKSWDTGITMTNAIITNLVVMVKSGSDNWFSLPNNDTVSSRIGLNNDGKIYIKMFTGNLSGQDGYAEIYYYINE